jgi:hypothetical protein
MGGIVSDVSPSSGFRFVCYCKDCQAFARLLDSADALDAAGGTDIFHTYAVYNFFRGYYFARRNTFKLTDHERALAGDRRQTDAKNIVASLERWPGLTSTSRAK